MSLQKKISRLQGILSRYGSCIIAFSGGVDSAFLAKVAGSVLPKSKVLAVTAVSQTYPREELLFAKKIARSLGIRHKIIRTREFKDKRFVANPVNRCYFCKRELFSKLKTLAPKFKLSVVADASNISDKSDFRPGNLAKEELKIRSPLQEAGFTKEDIRRASRKLGLATWDKPSLACLASRIPYGTKIEAGLLNRINKAENYLRGAGFTQVRVRHYNGLCRIEVLQKDIPALLCRRRQVVDKLKDLGYDYVTLDLEGFRTGSMNPVIPKKEMAKYFR